MQGEVGLQSSILSQAQKPDVHLNLSAEQSAIELKYKSDYSANAY